jgi:trimeric autotransporter adhesin
MTTLHLEESIGTEFFRGFLLIAVGLGCFALSPMAQAQGCPTLCSNENTVIGLEAFVSNTTGNYNTATGTAALFSNTTGDYNTASGANTLSFNMTGNNNTASGVFALYFNTTGNENTANGLGALQSNTTASNNTATGINALHFNTTGTQNTANGGNALQKNTTASNNTATGFNALFYNTTGTQNMADGAYALYKNSTGHYNMAAGPNALRNNVAGLSNTAVGFNALVNNIGSSNVAFGSNAGNALTTGSGNVCIGQGVFGVAGESNTTRIRNVYASVANGRAVYVNSDNKIGTLSSSRRYKEAIKPMENTSATLYALKPVTFRYHKDVDPGQALSFGLIAEEVAEANPDLITRDEEGKPQTVRYEAVNAMLLNEFLKEHRKNE